RVLKIDRNTKPIKISLGRKQTLSDPAIAAMGEMTEGTEVSGTVTRLTDFGAFIELSPGVEGLIHVSEVAHERIPTPAKVLRLGEVVQCRVLSVDRDRKRISLSRKALLERPAPQPSSRDQRHAGPAVPLREDDPEMRKLRARLAGGKRELKGGLG
ncbi:MAG: S1 RNA-binding domain-containing protein, partial [Phycisphaerae bacterium]|nr:S1 RNA-binding domain-containing protein [Phycisphaerae bacterium]